MGRLALAGGRLPGIEMLVQLVGHTDQGATYFLLDNGGIVVDQLEQKGDFMGGGHLVLFSLSCWVPFRGGVARREAKKTEDNFRKGGSCKVLNKFQRSGLLALLLLALVVPVWSAGAKKQKAVVSGVVQAASSDDKGNVLSVEILVGDDSDDPYLVADSGKGNELKQLVGQFVMAGGIVTEDANGWKTIEVTTYTTTDQLQQP